MREAFKQISDLVERFQRNIDAYHSPAYNETQLRIEFVDPFFEALGWDVTNKAGYAEQYKDIIHEDAIKISGATKAPDYCFRIGGVRKFFLETKKPSIDIKSQTSPAYQLRRYAWSAKLPLSILTDFQEMALVFFPVLDFAWVAIFFLSTWSSCMSSKRCSYKNKSFRNSAGDSIFIPLYSFKGRRCFRSPEMRY